MRFALLMYTDPAHTRAMQEPEFDAVMRKHAALRDELYASGELTGGAGLAHPEETSVVRLGPDGVVSRDGPLASDTHEHLSAYYELECADVRRAGEIAARILDDHVVAVEVRRIHDSA